MESMLYYMREFLENKFAGDFEILKAHIPELLDGNPSLVNPKPQAENVFCGGE